MRYIYPKIVELFETNSFSVLATIIGQSGSSPRGIGTKFLILEDGTSIGTIGGGALEAAVIEESEKVFAAHLPIRFTSSLMGSDLSDEEMICGGEVEVFLEPVYPDNLNHLYIFKQLMDVIRRGGSGLTATVIDTDRWQTGQIPKMFLNSNGESVGSLPGIPLMGKDSKAGMDRFLGEGRPAIVTCRDEEGNHLSVFVEPVISEPVLYIFGGGHVSSQVVPLAHKVGFKVVVIDDRAEFAKPEKFPEAEEVLHFPFEGVVDRLRVNGSSYLVIVTRGHSHDKTVLGQCLRSPAKYIGMIGSKRKISIIYRKLLEEGFTQKELCRVSSPIGIDIGAETIEEIGISIVAELIKTRAEG